MDAASGNDFDVVVIGSGAGGCAVTYHLVRRGLRVLLIERGRSLPRDGSTLDVGKVVHEGIFKSRESWATASGRRLVPEEYGNLGGKTKWYGAALARFSAAEFAADVEHQCRGWPLSYRDLEPYYEEIEALLGVKDFPCERDLATIVDRLAGARGRWRAQALPMGLRSEILGDPHEAAHFDGFASAAQLKSDGETALLSRIAQAPNLTISTGRAAIALVGAEGRPERIVGVRLEDGTQIEAPEVVLSMGALHSPRLLQRYLREADLGHLPAAGHVGRNLKLHLLTAVLAISRSPKTDLLRKTTLFTSPMLPHSSAQPLGFDGELIATLFPGYLPRPLARALGRRAYGFFLQTEDGSSPANLVGDAAPGGLPVFDYDAARTPAALAEHRRLVRLFCGDLRRAGCLAFAQRIGLHGTAHACGTLIAGSDPGTSVVDAAGRVHGLEGLSVADGSVLPRSSRVNPALTIYAFGLRAADLLALRFGSRASAIGTRAASAPGASDGVAIRAASEIQP